MNQNTQTAGRSGVEQRGNKNDKLQTNPVDWCKPIIRPDVVVVNGMVCLSSEFGDGFRPRDLK